MERLWMSMRENVTCTLIRKHLWRKGWLYTPTRWDDSEHFWGKGDPTWLSEIGGFELLRLWMLMALNSYGGKGDLACLFERGGFEHLWLWTPTRGRVTLHTKPIRRLWTPNWESSDSKYLWLWMFIRRRVTLHT